MSLSIRVIGGVGLLALLCASGAAEARGDMAAGQAKAEQLCSSCHGPDGNGIGDPQYPNIAGQHRTYLVHALRAYRSGERQNAIMLGFAQTLSDADINNLAFFYSRQKGLSDLTGIESR